MNKRATGMNDDLSATIRSFPRSAFATSACAESDAPGFGATFASL